MSVINEQQLIKELGGMVLKLLQFPYGQICKHSVAADLLSLLNDYDCYVSEELAEAIVTADDYNAIRLLRQMIKDNQV